MLPLLHSSRRVSRQSVQKIRYKCRALATFSERDSFDSSLSRPSTKKKRLDHIVLERHPHLSRAVVQSFIVQGRVIVDGKVASKCGMMVNPSSADICANLEVPKYVSRAGFKLEGALDQFGFDVQGLDALDSGLSTGGFTDCLLQRGVNRVVGVDVGTAQVAEKIRRHSKVTVMEKTNLRHLHPDDLPFMPGLVTLDLSFISLLKVMDAVYRCTLPDAIILAMVKPQFEAERGQVGNGGVVRNPDVRKEIIDRVASGIQTQWSLEVIGRADSQLHGADGNVECFLMLAKRKSM